MKKYVLFSLLITSIVFAFGQEKFTQSNGVNKDVKFKVIEQHPDQTSYYKNPDYNSFTREDFTIGTTWYDAQALNYGNMMQRIWAYPDGSLGAIWLSMGENNIPERGCGYNFYDGTSWGEEDPHVGPDDRMGTPSYAPFGDNGEIIAQYKYVSGAGPIQFYKRETKGTGDWEEFILNGPDGSGVSLVWQSLITSGENNEYIHLLALTYDAEYMGQSSALLYYRSSDGGNTWDIDGIIIDGLGEDYFKSINSLSYAWANPVGDNIAFSYGFDQFGGRVFKSDDNGDNWEIVDVYTTPFSGIDPPSDASIFGSGCGTSACALDSNGDVHVAFPRMRWNWAGGDVHYYPYTDGLIYWNESMNPLDTTSISSYTMEFLEEGGNLIGWVMDQSIEMPDGQPHYANGLCGFPQISIDGNDNLFVAFCAVSNFMSNTYGHYYRHIIVNSSFNGGLSWEGQKDLTDDVFHLDKECVFPAMAPIIDDKVHIVYQKDNIPGMHEWLNNHSAIENMMTWIFHDKDFFVSINEQQQQQLVPELSDGFPNPAQNMVYFTLKTEKNADVKLSLTNLVGQVIRTINYGSMQSGTNTLSIDVSEYLSGTYFCTVEINNRKLSRKIIVNN